MFSIAVPIGINYAIKNITDLQQIEQYMFQNLQALNKSSPDSIQQSDVIKQRLSEISAMLMTLFGQLKSMYADTQAQTANSRSDLADQITMTNVVDNELKNAKKELKALEQERLNKKRLVELGEYEYDRYTSHKNIIKVYLETIDGTTQELTDKIKLITKDQIVSEVIQSKTREEYYFGYYLN